MPNAQDQLIELDIYKSLIYKLCDFLIQKRMTPQGYGLRTPMEIPLEDFRPLFDYILRDDDEQKIEEIRKALKKLSDEVVPQGSELRAIVIIQSDWVEDTVSFRENFRDNGVLNIIYSTEDLEEYRIKLKQRTDAQHRAASGVMLTPKSNEGVTISLGNKNMSIRRGRDVRNLSVNIVTLLYGKPVDLPTGPVSLDNDYERGNHVGFDKLIEKLDLICGDFADTGTIQRKPVRDALTGLNKRAHKEKAFGRPIFDSDDEGVKWIL